MLHYAAVIYDPFNIIVEVHERRSAELARKAGEFWTKNRKGYWYHLVEGEEEIDLYKALINA